MPFRSEKSSPALSFEPVVRKLGLPCVVATILSVSPARATLTFDAVSPYQMSESDTIHISADPALVVGGVSYDATQLIDVEAGFQNFDFSMTADPDENLVEIQLDSGTTFSTEESGKRLVVVAYADTQNGGDPLPVPIHSVDGTACSSSNCSVTSEVGSETYYFAAHSSEESAIDELTLSLNPREICQAVFAQNSETPAVGCTDDEVETVTETNAVAFRLTFYAGYVDSTSPDAVFDTDDAKEESEELTISLHAKAPLFSCPSADDLYVPGDTQILLNTDFDFDEDSGDAPGDKLIVVGGNGAEPDTGSGWAEANEIAERLTPGSGYQTIEGFTNTTDGTDNAYQLRFSVRDVTGRMAIFTDAGDADCAPNDVRTAEVEGFLQSSSGCFIATAAFRDPIASPVLWLRQFRDRVLLHSRPGRWLVMQYYSWSPGAARWLLAHPLYRLPVLTILFPVASIAGLIVLLVTLGTAGGAGMAVIGILSGLAVLIRKGRR